MTYSIQIPPRTSDGWKWENYKARLAVKGLLVDVAPVTSASSTRSQKPKG